MNATLANLVALSGSGGGQKGPAGLKGASGGKEAAKVATAEVSAGSNAAVKASNAADKVQALSRAEVLKKLLGAVGLKAAGKGGVSAKAGAKKAQPATGDGAAAAAPAGEAFAFAEILQVVLGASGPQPQQASAEQLAAADQVPPAQRPKGLPIAGKPVTPKAAVIQAAKRGAQGAQPAAAAVEKGSDSRSAAAAPEAGKQTAAKPAVSAEKTTPVDIPAGDSVRGSKVAAQAGTLPAAQGEAVKPNAAATPGTANVSRQNTTVVSAAGTNAGVEPRRHADSGTRTLPARPDGTARAVGLQQADPQAQAPRARLMRQPDQSYNLTVKEPVDGVHVARPGILQSPALEGAADLGAAHRPVEPQGAPLPASPADQVIEAIRTSASREGGTVVIQLNPPELGRLRVTLTAEGKEARGLVQVDDPAVMDQIRREVPIVLGRLAEVGIQLKRMEVVMNDQGSGESALNSQPREDGWGSRGGPDGRTDQPTGSPEDLPSGDLTQAAPATIGEGRINLWI